MNTSFTAAQLDQLRRDAKRLARQDSIRLCQAQDIIAGKFGYRNWSLLAKKNRSSDLAAIGLADQKPGHADFRTRYYLHGDQYEPDSSRFYCASCDVFFDAAHFSSHGPHFGERFLDSLERWKKRDLRFELNRRRPDNAANLLEASALAARVEYQELRDEFGLWLKTQRKQQTSVGLLARLITTSRGLPKRPKSLLQLWHHTQRHGAWFTDTQPVDEAWAMFKASRNT